MDTNLFYLGSGEGASLRGFCDEDGGGGDDGARPSENHACHLERLVVRDGFNFKHPGDPNLVSKSGRQEGTNGKTKWRRKCGKTKTCI